MATFFTTALTDFAAEWPKYKGTLRDATGAIQGKISGIEGSVSELTTTGPTPKTPAAASGDGGLVHNFLVRGIGSLYALVLEGTFVPFLVFFMLAQKREVWHATLQLFPVGRRTQVKETLDDLRDVLRDYLIGMSVVTLVVIALSSMFFVALGLDYPVLAGIASGIFNMVPYIGRSPRMAPRLSCWPSSNNTRSRISRSSHLFSPAFTSSRKTLIAPAAGRPSGSSQRRGHHHRVAVLGLGVGRHGPDPRHPDYRGAARHLRPHRIRQTHRSLARRLTRLVRLLPHRVLPRYWFFHSAL